MTATLMAQEVRECPQAVARLLAEGRPAIRACAEAIRARDPLWVATVARGSSDHACTFFKYAAELMLGVPVASVGPSVASIYGAKLRFGHGLCITVSQSGQSPDIVAMAEAARAGGALTAAVTNHPASPLGQASDHVLALHAGPERSVAATKTFVSSAVTLLALLADWAQDGALSDALEALPDHLSRAVAQDWSAMLPAFLEADSLFTLGRGPGWAMANEAALKLKETCRIHAESYSSAEVLHGPVSIVDAGFPVLAFAAQDASEAAVRATADALAEKGARVFLAASGPSRATLLPVVRTGHPLTDPIALIASFYAFVEALSQARGINPDEPRHLRKVTETH